MYICVGIAPVHLFISFQVFNLKTITVNPIVYGYRIIKREIFFTCSAP